MMFLLISIVLIGVGIGIGLVISALAGGLVLAGTVSSSVALGIFTRRPATAVRAFLLQCGVLSGLLAGAGLTWLCVPYIEPLERNGTTIGLGSLAGALSGVVVALVTDYIFRKMLSWIEARSKQRSGA